MTRERMEAYVKSIYPHAYIECYWNTRFGVELHFRACDESDQTWCCTVVCGKLTILYEF